MKNRIATLATVAALGLTAIAPAASAQSMNEAVSMLTQAVENALRVEGFDTTGVEDLPLAQIAEIKSALEEGMSASNRSKIENLLAGN